MLGEAALVTCGHDLLVFEGGQPAEGGLSAALVVDAFDPGIAIQRSSRSAQPCRRSSTFLYRSAKSTTAGATNDRRAIWRQLPSGPHQKNPPWQSSTVLIRELSCPLMSTTNRLPFMQWPRPERDQCHRRDTLHHSACQTKIGNLP